jgi:NlpC/P60 family putative phage cell wall peptidase
MIRTQIIAEARSWIGTPYHYQASLKGVGCDCLGLLRGVWRKVMGEEPEDAPPYTADWAEASGEESLRDAARRHMMEIPIGGFSGGDLLLFRMSKAAPAKHCGIATDAAHMVHAWSGRAVTETPLGEFWTRRLAYAFRFPLISDH